ncbi:hypothetical protein BGZ65_010782 [Modicella reniformis]|uniref:Uncharacterized protein n=1 Tax=Modicella reniformis TaxID=1440133 RepID=A0A9P6LVW8_9FUNG|nr:hypothetical protein BGZ65_010782 [Modicella reniformis]
MTNGSDPVPTTAGESTPPRSATKPATATATTSTPTQSPKKKSPSGNGSSNSANGGSDEAINAESSNTSTADSELLNKTEIHHGPSKAVIALLVIFVLAVLAASLFGWYKVREAKRRRRQSWGEDILKNRSGSVGYTEGGGYGMYVGERKDPWKKNLDMFHSDR